MVLLGFLFVMNGTAIILRQTLRAALVRNQELEMLAMDAMVKPAVSAAVADAANARQGGRA